MPSLQTRLDDLLSKHTRTLVKRINIPVTSSSPPGLAVAIKQDPWSKAGKYALGWVYFSILLLVFTCAIHCYHWWTDKITRAEFKEEAFKSSKTSSPDTDYEMANLPTNNSSRKFFPRIAELPPPVSEAESSFASFQPLDKLIAMVRWVVYRPLPILQYKKREFSFPSIGTILIVTIATIFVTLYCFIPQPLYYASIAFGSPPVAIRAGMLAVAMMPWIVALSMKANLITMLTGIGHERLNVLHRWGAYICLFLSLIHTIPFYVTPIWDKGGLLVFKSYFKGQTYIYGTGIAALVPLLVLCVHSLPVFRRKMYELFVALHVPISIVYLAMLFWHCHNYLTSWNYLAATAGIWFISYCTRLFYLNWTNPRRMSWLIGEEAAVTILPENAVKVTIPSQVRWSPGQYVYLRMPGISIFENHPFTIASLCSQDFPSDYGEQYRDMTLVFRPFGGFTRKVLDAAIDKGPYKTFRAFIDGPYGGMQRDLASFDTVILFAGGSGITAIVSQLLDLIKKMRDGKAVTRKVEVVWALKRPETMEWFKEELRICREFAPLETVHCQFYITAAKRLPMGYTGPQQWPPSPARPVSDLVHGKINSAFQGIASKRNSALIREEAAGDVEKEIELRRENEDGITALPQPTYNYPPPPKKAHLRSKTPFKLTIPPTASTLSSNNNNGQNPNGNFDFGFPSTPTMLQKNLMRFAFLPSVSTASKREGWSTEYGRPDIPYMLRGFERGFGKRTCVFVCGPPGMRRDVQREVARMQMGVVRGGGGREEVYLHTENYAI
ncbi:MAG: hypothetical protein HETSPECPRED_000954 [Heterodermia speciosa]|uniref:ferric-chelate reductase (NADPH) n=1 Tax=Heterodermia speciosa TaxID=116794 RepID=A0A8H3ETS4_9LECA|nr:MAG: hypothetical protein HETSPECPRED_000954 [Heterodermia speciosa]